MHRYLLRALVGIALVCPAAVVVGGASGQLQFNNSGAFAGVVGSSVDVTSGQLSLGSSGTPAKSPLLLTPQSQPSAASEGAIYEDTAAHVIKFYNGTSWSQLGGSTLASVSTSSSAACGQTVSVTDLTANRLITMPAASSCPGGAITIRDGAGVAGGGIDGSGHILAITSSGGTLDGAAQEYVYNDGGWCTYQSDGTNWLLKEDGGCGVDPRGISGLQAWYDFGRGVTVSAISGSSVNQNLTQILDQSGNGHTLTPTNVNAGQYLPAGFNGRARFIFDATTNSLQSATMTPPSGNGTVLGVAALSTIGSSSVYYCLFSQGYSNTLTNGDGFAAFGNTGTTPQNHALSVLGGNIVIGTNMAGELLSSANNNSPYDFYLWAWSYSASASYVHFNGLNNTRSTSPATATTTPTAYTMSLGADRFTSGTVGDEWRGPVSELVWFTPDLTEAQLKPLEKTFLHKHNLRR